MNFEGKTLWGIHAGKTGDSDYLFLKKKAIGVGWAKIPDLKSLAHNREAFKELYQATYPNQKPGAVPVIRNDIEYPWYKRIDEGDEL